MAVTKQKANRAPTLYAIIAIKLAKGLLFVLLGLGIWSLVGRDLPAEFEKLVVALKFDPEAQFFSQLEHQMATVTPANIRWVASGALLYGMLSLGEAVGLVLRVAWVGWVVAAESAIFVPYEIYHLVQNFTLTVLVILLINIWIVWYLLRNRHRLFKHAHSG